MATASENIPDRINSILKNKNKTTVMFIGAPGAGKSSLINTLIHLIDSVGDTAQKKRNRCIPTAPPELMGGHTMMREPVQLTDGLIIVDNRGWHDWGNEVALKELVAQINGQRAMVDEVDWEAGGKEEELAGFAPVLADKMNSVTIVINGKGGLDALQDVGKLIMTCNKHTGRRPTIVVTHKDEMSEEQIKVIQSTLQTDYGIGRDWVFIVQNMTEGDTCLEEASKSDLLNFIDRCFSDGEMGARFHAHKEKMHQQLIEHRKQVEREGEAKAKKQNAKMLEEVVQETELRKLYNQQKNQQIETDKLKAIADAEESEKKAQLDHVVKMNQDKEENWLKLEKLKIETKKEVDIYDKELENEKWGKYLDKLAENDRIAKTQGN